MACATRRATSSAGRPRRRLTSPTAHACLLAQRVGAAAVVTGDDFTFGKGRAGSVQTLKTLGLKSGIAAEAVAPVLLDGTRISSGRIREALAAGDPGTATRLLSRPFAVEATVERGDGRGHELGCPTANVLLGDYQRPAYGIYAVHVRLDDDREYPGVASFGVRPTFEPPEELLEANLFGFDGDLYGRTIEISLHAYIRPERKFDDLSALSAQMQKDAAEARKLHALPA